MACVCKICGRVKGGDLDTSGWTNWDCGQCFTEELTGIDGTASPEERRGIRKKTIHETGDAIMAGKARLLITMMLMLCAGVWGANKWVATTGTNDGAAGRGDSVGDPYATVQYALDNMGGSGTVYVAAGTYSTDTYLHVDGTQNGWDIIIDGEGDTTIFSFSSASLGFYMLDDYASGSWEIKDVNAVSSGALTVGWVRMETTTTDRTGEYLKFNNVTVGDGLVSTQEGMYMCTGIDLVVFDSTFNFPGTGSPGLISAPSGMDDIIMINSDFTLGIQGDSVLVTGACGNVSLSGLTLKASGDAVSASSILEFDAVTSAGTFYANDLTFTVSGNNLKAINVPYYFTNVHINNITINNSASTSGGGIFVGADASTNANPIGQSRILSSTLTYTTDGQHGILVGAGADGCVVDNCVVAMPAGDDGGNLGIVIKGNYSTISNCDVTAERAIYFKGDSDSHYITNCYLAGTGTFSSSSCVQWVNIEDGDTMYIPEDNTITNCVLDGDAGVYTFSIVTGFEINDGTPDGVDTETSDNEFFFDKNIYSGSTILYDQPNTNSYTTLVAVQGYWDAAGNVYGTSGDDNSAVYGSISKKGYYLDIDNDGTKEWIGVPQTGGGSSGAVYKGLYSN